jgi:hypothetical protein
MTVSIIHGKRKSTPLQTLPGSISSIESELVTRAQPPQHLGPDYPGLELNGRRQVVNEVRQLVHQVVEYFSRRLGVTIESIGWTL